MTKFASKTSVPVDRSINEIKMLIKKYGGDGYCVAEVLNKASVQFVFNSKAYQFFIHYPTIQDDEIKLTDNGRSRTPQQMQTEVEAEQRRLWRSMALYIKAALEAHSNGLVDIKRSLFGHIKLPNGKTAYDALEGQLDKIEANPQLLLQ